jgi:ribonuclease HI
MGFPTFFVKVRAHRGEPYNEAADRIASTATEDEDAPLLLYSASLNDTVKNFIKNQAALSSLYSSITGVDGS